MQIHTATSWISRNRREIKEDYHKTTSVYRIIMWLVPKIIGKDEPVLRCDYRAHWGLPTVSHEKTSVLYVIYQYYYILKFLVMAFVWSTMTGYLPLSVFAFVVFAWSVQWKSRFLKAPRETKISSSCQEFKNQG